VGEETNEKQCPGYRGGGGRHQGKKPKRLLFWIGDGQQGVEQVVTKSPAWYQELSCVKAPAMKKTTAFILPKRRGKAVGESEKRVGGNCAESKNRGTRPGR